MHFQLRKNLKLVKSKDIVYFTDYSIDKFNIITNRNKPLVILNHEELENDFKAICLDVFQDNDYTHISYGKVNGTLKYKKMSNNEFYSKKSLNLTYEYEKEVQLAQGALDITNFNEFYDNGNILLTGSNDKKIRFLDLNKDFQVSHQIETKDAVNHCAINNNLLTSVGDYKEIDLHDKREAKKIGELTGHDDFNFVIKFQPGSDYIIASGGQDQTCRLWDLRKSIDGGNANFKSLYGNMEAIGDLMFVNDFVIYAENIDTTHIYNLKTERQQSLWYFGRTSGIAYNEKNKNIYVGVNEYDHSGIMVYDQINAMINI